MNVMWTFVALGAAGLSAHLLLRKGWFSTYPAPVSFLAFGILLIVFVLAPVHLVAALDVVGVPIAVRMSTISWVAVLLLLAVVMVSRASPLLPRSSPDIGDKSRVIAELPGYLRVAIAIAAVSWLLFIVNLVAAYSYGWDSFAYHLPLAVSWLQRESLRLPESGAWNFSLPGNGEIGVMLMLSAGLQRFAALFNWFAFAISLLSVYVLAFKVTADKQAAVAAGLLYSIVPIVQFQANSAYVDLYGTAFLLAALSVFVCRHDGQGHGRASDIYLATLALAGLGIGIAVGTKPTFYPSAALLAIGLGAVAWFERRQVGVSFPLSMVVFAVALLIPNYYWFLRALIATGNPIHPIPVVLFGKSVFGGTALGTITNELADMQFLPSRSRLEWFAYPWVEFKHTGYGYGVDSGLGAAWAAFVPFGIALGIPLALKGVSDKRWRLYALLFLAFVVFAILWWFGLRKLLRFAIPGVALTIVLSAPLLALFMRQKSKVFAAVLVASVATTSMLAAWGPLHSLLGLMRSRVWERADVLEYPEIIDRLPRGAVVWNASKETWNFALLGKDLSTRVVEEPWRGIDDAVAFIARNRIDFVVEQEPRCCDALAGLGAEIVFDGMVGPTFRWRVWRTAGLKDR